ncbi:hypothetical protein [Lentzea waywayandensis]|uniref:hypothetical protein n=1 Tax=Lentzea waywayandensis TaxID=84724 RepID=UPI000B85780D|nr:hypothetical protein [Lentzea waywayandensis]
MVGEPHDFCELEELFANELWARIANELWPRENRTPWTAAGFEAHRGGKFSADVQEMPQTQSPQGQATSQP